MCLRMCVCKGVHVVRCTRQLRAWLEVIITVWSHFLLSHPHATHDGEHTCVPMCLRMCVCVCNGVHVVRCTRQFRAWLEVIITV